MPYGHFDSEEDYNDFLANLDYRAEWHLGAYVEIAEYDRFTTMEDVMDPGGDYMGHLKDAVESDWDTSWNGGFAHILEMEGFWTIHEGLDVDDESLY